MPNCLEYAEQRTQSCAQYADQGYNACTQYRDDGYNSCSSWDSNCCTWWPCSWGCKLVTWFCVAWFWVSNLVCVAWHWVSNVVCVLWTMVTTLVCVLWDVVVTVVSAILVVVEAVLGWVLSLIAMVVELIFAIPYVGRFLQWLWNVVVLNLVWLVANLIDAGLYLIGVRPQKKLRICTVILRDERGNPVATVPAVVDLINEAIDIMLRECNVQIVNSAPLQFSSGLSFTPVRADASWVQIDGRPSATALLDSACDQPAFEEDLSDIGSRYQLEGLTNCFFGNWRNVVGLGTPMTVLIVRTITTPTRGFGGCCIWVSNYLTIAASSVGTNRTLAHELGHACNLWHLTDPPNLMDVTSPGPGDSILRLWQELLVRASRHVSYF
jgi:hypothetical protein